MSTNTPGPPDEPDTNEHALLLRYRGTDDRDDGREALEELRVYGVPAYRAKASDHEHTVLPEQLSYEDENLAALVG